MAILNHLVPLGWIPFGKFMEMLFEKSGKRYDLSAADLNQLDRIEREGLFLV